MKESQYNVTLILAMPDGSINESNFLADDVSIGEQFMSFHFNEGKEAAGHGTTTKNFPYSRVVQFDVTILNRGAEQ